MRYLGANGRIVGGRILFKGRDLLQLSPKMLRQVRGAEIAMVYQEPTTALNPSLTIGTQLREVLRYHRRVKKSQATERIAQMLADVRLADADHVMAAYPHQLSGGQQQRVVIAMALLAQPSLLLLDEPTTALDVTIAAGIVELIKAVRQKFGTSMLYISHDLGRVREVCDRVYVMYAGRWLSQARPHRCLTPHVIPIRVDSYAPYHCPVCRNRLGHCRPCAASLPSLANGRWDASLARGVMLFSPGSVMLSSFPSMTLTTLLPGSTCGVSVGRT